jgi:hypothetical protein
MHDNHTVLYTILLYATSLVREHIESEDLFHHDQQRHLNLTQTRILLYSNLVTLYPSSLHNGMQGLFRFTVIIITYDK